MRRSLLAWYDERKRDLPWREDQAPYRVWVSEIMLQQTRVQTVIPYFQRFVAAFPTVADLAAARLESVLRLWQGLGYYSRARNLHAAAREIAGPRGGRFPESAEAWQALPGVGRYTAAAIASIALGEAAAALDGNIRRVLIRLLALRRPVARPETQRALWAAAGRLLDPARPGDFNQAMMELGATVCRPRGPDCGACPLRAVCAARAEGLADVLPLRAVRAAPRAVFATAVGVFHRGRCLLVRRPARGLLGGLWSLPTWEHPAAAMDEPIAAICLKKSLGIQLTELRVVGCVAHAFTHRSLQLRVARARLAGPLPVAAANRVWLSPARFGLVALARLDQKALALLSAR